MLYEQHIIFSHLSRYFQSKKNKEEKEQQFHIGSTNMIGRLVAAIRLEKEIINYSVMSPRQYLSLH